jgi:hypothetical protein
MPESVNAPSVHAIELQKREYDEDLTWSSVRRGQLNFRSHTYIRIWAQRPVETLCDTFRQRS